MNMLKLDMPHLILVPPVIHVSLSQGVTQGEYTPMEDSEETSQSIPIDLGPLQSDQPNNSSSQDGQSKRDDVIVIDSDDEDDDDEENEGEQEVRVAWNYFIYELLYDFIFDPM